MAARPFVDAVTNKLTFLLSEYGFRVTEASEHVVLLETRAGLRQLPGRPRQRRLRLSQLRAQRVHHSS